MTYEEIANVVKNSYERYFLVQYQDGRKERVPLFYNGKVCKFKKNSRRYGYLFDTEGIVAIQPCLTNALRKVDCGRINSRHSQRSTLYQKRN